MVEVTDAMVEAAAEAFCALRWNENDFKWFMLYPKAFVSGHVAMRSIIEAALKAA